MSVVANLPVANIGVKVYMSDYKVPYTESDIIGEIASITGFNFSVDTVDSPSVTSETGFERQVPTIKRGSAGSFVLYKKTDNWNKIYQQFFNRTVTSDSFFKTITLVFPKNGFNQGVPDIELHGFISGVDPFTEVNTTTVQSFGFSFQVNDIPTLVAPVPAPVISSSTISPSTLDKADGGSVEVTLTGTNLPTGLTVVASATADGVTPTGLTAKTTGTPTSQKATFTIPPYTSTGQAEYTFEVIIPNANVYNVTGSVVIQ